MFSTEVLASGHRGGNARAQVRRAAGRGPLWARPGPAGGIGERCQRCRRERLITTVLRNGLVVCGECATEANLHAKPTLDEVYRNGGAMKEDWEGGRDLVTEMVMLGCRPDVLANELKRMGVSQDGDEVLDD